MGRWAWAKAPARAVAEQTQRPYVMIDDARYTYYSQYGYDPAEAQRLWETGGSAALLDYWSPFEARLLVQVLTDHDEAIIDVGGGYTIQRDSILRERVVQALAPHVVIVLLPALNVDAAVAWLHRRIAGKAPDDFDVADHVARHFATQNMADLVLITGEQSTAALCATIIQALDKQRADGVMNEEY